MVILRFDDTKADHAIRFCFDIVLEMYGASDEGFCVSLDVSPLPGSTACHQNSLETVDESYLYH